MRVLILATDIFTRGGIARYTYTLASSLGKMLGPENVDVLCFFDWGHPDNLSTDFRVSGMVSARARAGVSAQLKFLAKAAIAGTKRYDLVIANHVALAPVAALLKTAFGTPFWVSCHSVEIWWGTSRVRHAALKRADLILPVSRYTAEVVGKLDGIESSRIKVLYNAVPAAFARLLLAEEPVSDEIARLKQGGPLLLSVTSLVKGNEFKGIDTVIRALPRILKTQPNAQYVIAGDGEIRPRLESLARETGVAERVIFLGEVSDQQLAELYRGCDLFVLPSRGQEMQGGIGGEGFGRVYVEAALAAKPVIGSSIGGAAEAVLDGVTGMLVKPAYTEDVAEAVIAMAGNPRLAAQMGATGRKWALSTFSEEALSQSLKDLLRLSLASDAMPKLVHAGEQS